MDIDERLEESIENKYMQDDKGKNKMKLTVEESFYILKRKDFNSYVEEKAIEVLSSELDKDNKIINDMAEHIEKGCDFDNRIKTKEQIIDYFTNKYEEGE